ncbi:MAG: PmoA family protein [Gemmatimonadetes bacterium]|nr:PmoA family protein [Gemmatimonadota bacterium]
MTRDTFERNLSHLRLEVNEGKGFEVYAGQADRKLLARYDTATGQLPRDESPKPCFHPVFTPSGGLITEYRPEDHTWHTGLYFGWVHVNDTNFWGGSWYLPDEGKYVPVPNSHGVQRHDEFTSVSDLENGVAIEEKLTWLDRGDHPVIKEKRRFDFLETANPPGCLWLIESVMEPIVGAITFGASRAARYSGMVLRMGPPFADAFHTSGSGRSGHESIMGTRDRWVAAAGAGGGMVVMMDHPRNLRHPVNWFTRRNLLGTGPLMEGDLFLDASDSLHLRYGFLVLDDVLDQREIEDLYRTYLAESDERSPA